MRIMPAHDPDGTTMNRYGSNVAITLLRDRARVLCVAFVVGRLAAAGLHRHLDVAACMFEQLRRRKSDLRPEHVGEAGDEERNLGAGRHGAASARGACRRCHAAADTACGAQRVGHVAQMIHQYLAVSTLRFLQYGIGVADPDAAASLPILS